MLWDAGDGHSKGMVRPDAPTSAIALGPEGELAAACGGSVNLWDVPTLKPLPGLGMHQPAAWVLRFSPDGSMLAVAGITGVEVWDPSANALLASAATAERVHQLAFSTDGRTLAASAEGGVRIWAVVEPIGRSRLAAPDAKPIAHPWWVGFGPDGLLAATFFNNGKTASARFLCPSSSPSKFAGKDHLLTLALGFDDRGRLIVPAPGRLDVFGTPHDSKPQATIALPEGPSPTFAQGSNHPADSPEVFGSTRSADGRILALSRVEDIVVVRFSDGLAPVATSVRFADSARSRNRGRGPGPDAIGGTRGPAGPSPDRRGRPNEVRIPRNLLLSPQGDRLYAIAFAEGRTHPRAWAIDGAVATDLDWKGLPGDATKVALSADGRTLAVGRATGEVALFDARLGSPVGLVPAGGDSGPVLGLAFSARGDLAVGGRSGSVRLWSLSPPPSFHAEPLVILPSSDHGEVKQLAFDPRGVRLAVGDDSGIDIWDLDRVRSRLAALGLGW